MAEAHFIAGVPAHLQPDGPFAELLPKNRPVTADLLQRFRDFMTVHERLLSPAHLAAIDTWLAGQSDADPEIGKARAPELHSYLRQVAASTIVNGDERGVERLAKAAFVMSVGDDPRDDTWRLLRFAAQAAAALSASPGDMLADIARRFGPVSEQVLQKKWRYLERLDPMPVTFHQPSGLPLLEPAWDAEENAKRLGVTAWLLDKTLSQYSLPWAVPPDAYAGAAAESAPDAFAFVDALNQFLLTGSGADARRLVANAVSNSVALRWATWAALFWHGDRWPGEFPELVDAGGHDLEGQPGGGLVAVARGGTVQVSWTLA